jgi:hypothetical protein
MIIDLELPMIKHVALISLGVGLVMSRMVPFPFLREPPAYSLYTLDPVEMAQKSRLLDEQLKARYYFAEVRDGILERLAQGKMSLMEACDRIYHTAQEIYPRFVRFLTVDEKLDPKRKLAWNVVEQFRMDGEDPPSLNAIVQRLEKEISSSAFQTWCQETWKR